MEMRKSKRRNRQKGSVLVLALIAILVIVVLVTGMVTSSQGEFSKSSISMQNTQSWLAAHSGIWASAQELAQTGGDGNVTGSSKTGIFTTQTAADGNGDNFGDFSADSVFRAAADGYFEGRAYDVSGNGTKLLIRARSKYGDVLKTLEAMVERESTDFRPFGKGAFGEATFQLNSNVVTDSYDSDVDEYADHSPTDTDGDGDVDNQDKVNGQWIMNQNGDIGSNNNINMNSNVYVFGDAKAGATDGSTTYSTSGGDVSGDRTPLTSPVDNPPPSWTVPAATALGVQLVSGVLYNGAFNSNSGTTTLAPGKYVFSSFKTDSDANVLISGNVGDVIEIYITGGDSSSANPSFWIDGNSRFELINRDKTTGPTVIVYNVGKMRMDSNSELNINDSGGASDDYVGDPIQFQYYSDYASSSNTDYGVEFNSNANMSGVVYAPDGHIHFNSNANMYGAMVGNKMNFDSNVFFHYDESLANLGTGTAADPYYVPKMIHELR